MRFCTLQPAPKATLYLIFSYLESDFAAVAAIGVSPWPAATVELNRPVGAFYAVFAGPVLPLLLRLLFPYSVVYGHSFVFLCCGK